MKKMLWIVAVVIGCVFAFDVWSFAWGPMVGQCGSWAIVKQNMRFDWERITGRNEWSISDLEE